MTLTRRTSSALAALTLALGSGLGLAGCSSDDDKPGGTGTLEGNVATAAGVSFEIPEGWEAVDPSDLAAGAEGTSELADVADRLGLEPEALQQQMAGVDLIVFSDDVDNPAFRDNVNVTSPGGSVPSEDELAAQFESFNATIGEVTSSDTGVGEAITLTYTFPIQSLTVQGTAIVVEIDGEAVVITVSAAQASKAEEVSDDILDSLTEA